MVLLGFVFFLFFPLIGSIAVLIARDTIFAEVWKLAFVEMFRENEILMELSQGFRGRNKSGSTINKLYTSDRILCKYLRSYFYTHCSLGKCLMRSYMARLLYTYGI